VRHQPSQTPSPGTAGMPPPAPDAWPPAPTIRHVLR